MKLHRIEHHRRIAAPPAQVWALLADARGWPDWTPIDAAELERTGSPTDDGVGALRRFTTGRVTSREEVRIFEPERHLSYILLSGLPLRGYRADVTLRPTDDGGTDVRWVSSFVAKVPGTGFIYRRELDRFLGRILDGLATELARRPATDG